MEKAHPDVLNLFYQAFDKGELADGEGRIIDCKNVVFFLTSNLGFQTIVDYAERTDELLDALYPELAGFFKPALLARMEIVPYLPLGHDTLVQIVGGKLNRLVTLLKDRFSAEVVLGSEVAEEILVEPTEARMGLACLSPSLMVHCFLRCRCNCCNGSRLVSPSAAFDFRSGSSVYG